MVSIVMINIITNSYIININNIVIDYLVYIFLFKNT
jgi:hypothetical protein